jgi:hypothetical protein
MILAINSALADTLPGMSIVTSTGGPTVVGIVGVVNSLAVVMVDVIVTCDRVSGVVTDVTTGLFASQETHVITNIVANKHKNAAFTIFIPCKYIVFYRIPFRLPILLILQ